MSKRQAISRRGFLGGASAAAAIALVPRHAVAASGETPPSERLNVAFIGVGGRGADNLKGISGQKQNVVALCDVDEQRAGKAFDQFPKAKKHRDFRKMFDAMEKQIDAVAVSTPDHTHTVAAMAAIRRGKHLYCEKPLAHSIAEVRTLMKAAREHKVVTQLGNQGHSFDHIRLFCEWIWDGAIGNVHTVHAFRDSNYSRIDKLSLVKEPQPVPSTLDWDLWLGPATPRPYRSEYLPGKWRGWMPFGTGVLGDWTCHIVDPVFWALDLGAPKTILAKAQGYDPKAHADTFPRGTVIQYEFPAKGKRGPVTLFWYDGAEKPSLPEGLDPKDMKNTCAIVLGDKGGIRYGSHGATGVRIFPEEKMKAYQRPAQTLPRVAGHYQDWIEAIRKGTKAGSNFDYGGPLSEIALLGVIGIRMLGTRLEWDGEKMRFTNCDEANGLLASPYRKEWAI